MMLRNESQTRRSQVSVYVSQNKFDPGNSFEVLDNKWILEFFGARSRGKESHFVHLKHRITGRDYVIVYRPIAGLKRPEKKLKDELTLLGYERRNFSKDSAGMEVFESYLPKFVNDKYTRGTFSSFFTVFIKDHVRSHKVPSQIRHSLEKIENNIRHYAKDPANKVVLTSFVNTITDIVRNMGSPSKEEGEGEGEEKEEEEEEEEEEELEIEVQWEKRKKRKKTDLDWGNRPKRKKKAIKGTETESDNNPSELETQSTESGLESETSSESEYDSPEISETGGTDHGDEDKIEADKKSQF